MIKYYIGIAVITCMVFVAVIYGFNSGGSPASVRDQKFDAQRVSDIAQLKRVIALYEVDNKKVPASLNDLGETYIATLPKDPETGKDYGYIPNATSYQLCATFGLSNMDRQDKQQGNLAYYGDNFQHPKGYYCFDTQVTSSTSSRVPIQPLKFTDSFTVDPLMEGTPAAGYKARVTSNIRNVGSSSSLPYSVLWTVDHGTTACDATSTSSATCVFNALPSIPAGQSAVTLFDFNPTASSYKVCVSVNSQGLTCKTYGVVATPTPAK